jgi:hypothetical protein
MFGQGNPCSARNSNLQIPEYKVKMQITKPRLSVPSPNENLSVARHLLFRLYNSVVAKFVILACWHVVFGENFCYRL